MKISITKIIIFTTFVCTIAFAGGIEEDSGPEVISEEKTMETKDYDADLTTREDIIEYQDISDVNCKVQYALGYVNDPDFVAWSCK